MRLSRPRASERPAVPRGNCTSLCAWGFHQDARYSAIKPTKRRADGAQLVRSPGAQGAVRPQGLGSKGTAQALPNLAPNVCHEAAAARSRLRGVQRGMRSRDRVWCVLSKGIPRIGARPVASRAVRFLRCCCWGDCRFPRSATGRIVSACSERWHWPSGGCSPACSLGSFGEAFTA